MRCCRVCGGLPELAHSIQGGGGVGDVFDLNQSPHPNILSFPTLTCTHPVTLKTLTQSSLASTPARSATYSHSIISTLTKPPCTHSHPLTQTRSHPLNHIHSIWGQATAPKLGKFDALRENLQTAEWAESDVCTGVDPSISIPLNQSFHPIVLLMQSRV